MAQKRVMEFDSVASVLQYIKGHNEENVDQVLNDVPFGLQGLSAPSFHWNPDQTLALPSSLTHSTASFLHLLAEPAMLYYRIQRLIMGSGGLALQALHDCVESELGRYLVILGTLETRARKHEGTLIEDQDLLFNATLGLRFLYSILSDMEVSKKPVLNVLWPLTLHGDIFIAKYASKIYQSAKAPILLILNEWINRGVLNDPFHEFFIEIHDPTSPWTGRYGLNESKLPPEFPIEQARIISDIGKSVYFLRHLCNVSKAPECSVNFSGNNPNEILYKELTVYRQRIVEQVCDTLITQFDLRAHLQGLKDYMLLTKGDFVSSLLAEALPVLVQPQSELYRHQLVPILEAALTSSNAQFDPPQVLACLDARMLDLNGGELGWEVFTLEYKLQSPLDVILTPKATRKYLQIFNMLWSLRWAATNLQATYTQINDRSSQVGDVLNDFNLHGDWRFCAETCQMMAQFLTEIQGYIYTNVIETAWKCLLKVLDNPTTVDHLIDAHLKFLSTIVQKALFGGGEVVRILHELVRIIVDFKASFESIHDGVTTGSFEQSEASVLFRQVVALRSSFLEKILELMQKLEGLDEDTRSFVTRINFNNFYYNE